MKILDLTFVGDEVRRVQIAEDMYLVFDAAGTHYRPDGMRWDHLCGVIEDIVEGPSRKRIAAFLGPGHRIVIDDPITIEGSLKCLSCGLHGFVREGSWIGA